MLSIACQAASRHDAGTDSLLYSQGYLNAGTQAYLLDSLRWIADYFVECHHADLAFTAQVGDANLDHKLWERAEDMQENRPSYDVTPSLPGVSPSETIC